MLNNPKFVEAMKELKQELSGKYVEPNAVYDALNVREIDEIIQIGKEQRHPNKKILDLVVTKFSPFYPDLSKAKLVHIRSYPSKVLAEKKAANPAAYSKKKKKKKAPAKV